MLEGKGLLQRYAIWTWLGFCYAPVCILGYVTLENGHVCVWVWEPKWKTQSVCYTLLLCMLFIVGQCVQYKHAAEYLLCFHSHNLGADP